MSGVQELEPEAPRAEWDDSEAQVAGSDWWILSLFSPLLLWPFYVRVDICVYKACSCVFLLFFTYSPKS